MLGNWALDLGDGDGDSGDAMHVDFGEVVSGMFFCCPGRE